VSADAAALEGIIGWLDDWPSTLQGKIQHAWEILNFFLDGLPSALVDRARQLWQQISDYTDKILKWFQEELLPVVRSPLTLWDASQSWTDDVLSKVSAAEGQLDVSQFGADDYWHGPAARAYGQAAQGQQKAAGSVAGSVGGIHDAVQTLAIAVGVAYIALVAAVALAGIDITAGTATLFGVITIPVGLAEIVKGLLEALAGVGALAGAVEVFGNEALSAFSDLRKSFNDNTALDHGAWPKAAARLGDASMTDGDRSDWTYYSDPTN
jgi:hypothetical protein